MNPRRLALCTLTLLATACVGAPPNVDPSLVQRHARSLVPVLDNQTLPYGVGVVVRSTHDYTFLVASPGLRPFPTAPSLPLDGQRLAVRDLEVDGAHVLKGLRAGHDLRATIPAPLPPPGTPVLVVTPAYPSGLDARVTRIADDPLPSLEPLPPREADDAPPEERAQAALGAPVLSTDGAWLGFAQRLHPDDPERLQLLPVTDLLPELRGLLQRDRSAEVTSPEDDRIYLRTQIRSARRLPAVPDTWGEPDYFLRLTIAGRDLPPLELPRGPWAAPPRVLWVPAARDAVAQIVERDTTLNLGNVDRPVTDFLRRNRLQPDLLLPFELDPEWRRQHPDAPPSQPQVRLSLASINPDADSGDDATPLGTLDGHDAPTEVRAGSVDLDRGDATDFFGVSVPAPGPYWLLTLRRRPNASVEFEVFAPGFVDRLAHLPPQRPGHFDLLSTDLPQGRIAVRVRAEGEHPALDHYAFTLVPKGDLPQLLRALLLLLEHEAERFSAAAIDQPEFVNELAVALAFDANVSSQRVVDALLPNLGHPTPAIRHLVYQLLEIHFLPSLERLESLRSTQRGPAALDASLLLAHRDPRDPRNPDVVRAASRSPDPVIRLRGLLVALRLPNPDARASLARLFARDPSPLVRNVYERS